MRRARGLLCDRPRDLLLPRLRVSGGGGAFDEDARLSWDVIIVAFRNLNQDVRAAALSRKRDV